MIITFSHHIFLSSFDQFSKFFSYNLLQSPRLIITFSHHIFLSSLKPFSKILSLNLLQSTRLIIAFSHHILVFLQKKFKFFSFNLLQSVRLIIPFSHHIFLSSFEQCSKSLYFAFTKTDHHFFTSHSCLQSNNCLNPSLFAVTKIDPHLNIIFLSSFKQLSKSLFFCSHQKARVLLQLLRRRQPLCTGRIFSFTLYMMGYTGYSYSKCNCKVLLQFSFL